MFEGDPALTPPPHAFCHQLQFEPAAMPACHLLHRDAWLLHYTLMLSDFLYACAQHAAAPVPRPL